MLCFPCHCAQVDHVSILRQQKIKEACKSKIEASQRGDLLVCKTHPPMLKDQRRLTTLEPRLDFSVLSLTLVTTTRRLAVSRRSTTTFSNPLVVGTPVVAQVAQNRGVPCLRQRLGLWFLMYGEGGKEGRQRRRPGRRPSSLNRSLAASYDVRCWYSWWHDRCVVGCAVEVESWCSKQAHELREF